MSAGKSGTRAPHIFRKQKENLWVASSGSDGLQVILSVQRTPLTALRVKSCLYQQVESGDQHGRNL